MLPTHRKATSVEEVLREEFGYDRNKLKKELSFDIRSIQSRPLNRFEALKLAKRFNTSTDFWLNLDSNHRNSKSSL